MVFRWLDVISTRLRMITFRLSVFDMYPQEAHNDILTFPTIDSDVYLKISGTLINRDDDKFRRRSILLVFSRITELAAENVNICYL